MAHDQQFQFIETLASHYPQAFHQKKVAEIGALDINGSVRRAFNACDYTGYDLQLGPGVDQAVQGQLISEPTAHFDTVISAECFEHNPYWVETFSNMLRMTKPGGMVIFTCATHGRQEHGTSRTDHTDSPFTSAAQWDYYRNLSAEDFRNNFHLDGWFDAYHFLVCAQSFDLYFYGIRSNQNVPFDEALFLRAVDAIELTLQNLNLTFRIGRWTKNTGWIPRLVNNLNDLYRQST